MSKSCANSDPDDTEHETDVDYGKEILQESLENFR